MSPLVFILVSSVCSVAGQLALKRGMSALAGLPTGLLIRRIVFSPWVVGGLGIYGFGVLFWIIALSHLELSYAYPFSVLAYVGIILGSWLLFKERLSRARLVGIGAILIGLLLISQS